MSMLAELVEVVIGVDTHNHTHTAAVVDARTGAVLASGHRRPPTRTATPSWSALAEQHSGLRAWAIEGTGGYGAGLARHLAERGELVVELDRPVRPARRAGAKSDPIDAERAARDALARTQLAQPKTGAAAGRAAGAAHRAPRRGRRGHRRAAAAARAGHHRPRAGPGPVPRPVHPRHAHHRRPAAPGASTRRRRGRSPR